MLEYDLPDGFFTCLVGGLVAMFYFPIYWECHHPNGRTHIFQRDSNHQPDEYILVGELEHVFPYILGISYNFIIPPSRVL